LTPTVRYITAVVRYSTLRDFATLRSNNG